VPKCLQETKPLTEAQKLRMAAVEIRVEKGRIFAWTPIEKGGQGKEYEIKAAGEGALKCQCMGFKWSAGSSVNRVCKHVLAVLQREPWEWPGFSEDGR